MQLNLFDNRFLFKEKCSKIPVLTFLQQIDGEAFLLLDQSDIVNILKIKLGPALKIFNTIPKIWWGYFSPHISIKITGSRGTESFGIW